MKHELPVTVYLEDTDAQGIIYHANYLKYCERGRTEWLGEQGFALARLQSKGFTFVVHGMRLKYRKPGRLHDRLTVTSTASRSSAFRIRFEQTVERAGEVLFVASVDVVTVGDDGSLRRLPRGLLDG